jgi:hypothetical protein
LQTFTTLLCIQFIVAKQPIYFFQQLFAGGAGLYKEAASPQTTGSEVVSDTTTGTPDAIAPAAVVQSLQQKMKTKDPRHRIKNYKFFVHLSLR